MDPVVRREPREPEADREVDRYGFEPVERGYEPIHPTSGWRELGRKLWAPILLIGVVLWKFKAAFAAIFKLKLFTVVGSAFVSVAAYALIWGWQFGLGLVLLLFVHELGHVAVARYQGLPVSAPVFIPFMGALILMKEMPQNAWREAQIALGGPILGSIGALGFWAAGEALGSDLLVALAYVGFFLNLFNLIPVLPLDGGRAIGAVHPVFWILGAAVLVVAAVLWLSPAILIIVALLGGIELWGRAKEWWRNRGVEGGNRYYSISPWQRLAVGAVYVGLAGALVLGMAATQVPQDRL
ncbi:MAG TPA: site-2 protease family protein [Gaiellaceae bacterium]|nr:site-2 protease family protein [Gaiellaceae bacterium]